MINPKATYIEARRLPKPDKELWAYFFQLIDVALEGAPTIKDRLHGPVQRSTWPTDSEYVLIDREVTSDPIEPRRHWLSATPKSRKPRNEVEFVEDKEVVSKATGVDVPPTPWKIKRLLAVFDNLHDQTRCQPIAQSDWLSVQKRDEPA